MPCSQPKSYFARWTRRALKKRPVLKVRKAGTRGSRPPPLSEKARVRFCVIPRLRFTLALTRQTANNHSVSIENGYHPPAERRRLGGNQGVAHRFLHSLCRHQPDCVPSSGPSGELFFGDKLQAFSRPGAVYSEINQLQATMFTLRSQANHRRQLQSL
jgi:hypothetical protein